MQQSFSSAQLLRWRLAIMAIFLSSGLSMATWAARVPTIKEELGLDRAQLGIIMFAAGCCTMAGIAVSSMLANRFGSRRSMLGLILTFATGVALIGIGAQIFQSLPLVLIGLMLWALGNGALDILMNVEGAAVEAATRKTLLPLFHGLFSLGTVMGASITWIAYLLNISIVPHTLFIAALLSVVAFAAIAYVPVRIDAEARQRGNDPEQRRQRRRASIAVWREPRTYFLGILMLGMSFAEGSANDWLSLSMIEGHGTSQAMGAAGLTIFSVCMTTFRLVGGPIVDRFGRVATLRILAIIATAGILIFILGTTLPMILIGAALWGLGTSLGFPLGMSAAGDDPHNATTRVAACATFGYIAFLAGPPLLGLISENIGLLNTLFIITGLIVLSGLISGTARPPRIAIQPGAQHPTNTAIDA